jgi:hypothetical protein
MEGILAEVGMADALLARRLPDGTLELLDGHLRADLVAEAEVPVLIVDLSEEEAKLLLAVHDPIGAMAEANEEALRALLGQLESDQAGLQDLLLELSGNEGEADELRASAQGGPPGMDLQPYEHYDYVVFLFRSKLDFSSACEQLGLGSVQASAVAGKRKIGLGRCLDGRRLIELLIASMGRARS